MTNYDLDQQLRGIIGSYMNSRLDEVRNSLSSLNKQIGEELARIPELLKADNLNGGSLVSSISDLVRQTQQRDWEELATKSDHDWGNKGLAILKSAVEEIDHQRSQTDILRVLVDRASAFAPRIAFFVIKNGRAIGWRARGLEGTIGDDRIREHSLPLESQTIISQAVHTRRSRSGPPEKNLDNENFISALGDEDPEYCAAVPLIVRDKPVAVLYADSARLEASSVSLEAIETLIRVTAMAVELLVTNRPASEYFQKPSEEQFRFWQDGSRPRREKRVAEAGATVSKPQTGGELFSSPSPGKDLQADREPAADVTEAGGSSRVDRTEPLGDAPHFGTVESNLPVDTSEDEKRLHNFARRFARLLVSEIKLYNEQKLREGRAAHNIYERLREDIDRSRQMYDMRVVPSVASSYDYFHREIVDTLAEGDPENLGPSYPGARV